MKLLQLIRSDSNANLLGLAALVKPAPVTLRTLDLGGDKVLPYGRTPQEENPALGWRALRMGLDRPGLTRYQLRALIHASAGRELKVLFPMVADVSELAAARQLLEQELEHALKHGRQPPASVEAGMMLETCSLAFAPDAALKLADFVAIGANDLMQYFYAADRQNPFVADRYDVIAPGALSMLKAIREACDRHGKPVSVCGEIAGRPLEACVLAALGYRRLSMAASNVGPVKRALRKLDCGKLGAWLAEAMEDLALSPSPELRKRLVEAGENAGLPIEAVDKPARP